MPSPQCSERLQPVANRNDRPSRQHHRHHDRARAARVVDDSRQAPDLDGEPDDGGRRADRSDSREPGRRRPRPAAKHLDRVRDSAICQSQRQRGCGEQHGERSSHRSRDQARASIDNRESDAEHESDDRKIDHRARTLRRGSLRSLVENWPQRKRRDCQQSFEQQFAHAWETVFARRFHCRS